MTNNYAVIRRTKENRVPREDELCSSRPLSASSKVDVASVVNVLQSPGAGHLLNLEQPERFNRLLLRFLG